MNASSKPLLLSFSTRIFAFSCFLEAKTWIVYDGYSGIVVDGLVTTGFFSESIIFGVFSLEGPETIQIF